MGLRNIYVQVCARLSGHCENGHVGIDGALASAGTSSNGLIVPESVQRHTHQVISEQLGNGQRTEFSDAYPSHDWDPSVGVVAFGEPDDQILRKKSKAEDWPALLSSPGTEGSVMPKPKAAILNY